jgi:MGT family glycosyltransferase
VLCGCRIAMAVPRAPRFTAYTRAVNVSTGPVALRTLDDAASFYVHRPDLMIYDAEAFAGRVLAKRWAIPSIQISPHFAYERSSLHLQIRDDEFRAWYLHWSTEVDAVLRRHGVDEHEWLFHRERLNIHTFPREFEPSQHAVADERNFYAGRCAAESPCYGQWKNKDSVRRIALISAATTYTRDADYFKMCIAALTGLDWHTILSLGEEFDPAPLMPLPPHFEILRGVSHTQIYPYAAMVFFSGGTASSSEAAYHGVPLIVTSCGSSELEGLGDNINWLGFGRHIRKDETSVARLREVALEVSSSPRISDNVRR